MDDQEFEVSVGAQPQDNTPYAFVCDSLRSAIAKSGLPKFELQLRLVTAADGKPVDCAGWEHTYHVSRSPAAAWQVRDMLIAFGIGTSGDRAKFRASQIQGHIVQGLVQYEEYNGRKLPKVVSLIQYQGPPLVVQPTPAPKDDIPF